MKDFFDLPKTIFNIFISNTDKGRCEKPPEGGGVRFRAAFGRASPPGYSETSRLGLVSLESRTFRGSRPSLGSGIVNFKKTRLDSVSVSFTQKTRPDSVSVSFTLKK